MRAQQQQVNSANHNLGLNRYQRASDSCGQRQAAPGTHLPRLQCIRPVPSPNSKGKATEGSVPQLPEHLLAQYNHICVQMNSLDTQIEEFAAAAESARLSTRSGTMISILDKLSQTLESKLRKMVDRVSDTKSAEKIGLSGDVDPENSQNSNNFDKSKPLTQSQIDLAKRIAMALKSDKANRISTHKNSKEVEKHAIKTTSTSNPPMVTQTSINSSSTQTGTSLDNEKCAEARDCQNKTENCIKYTKVRHFDVILKLHKINFIDKQQSALLKKKVIRKDAEVTAALRRFEGSNDLKVLVQELEGVLAEAYSN